MAKHMGDTNLLKIKSFYLHAFQLLHQSKDLPQIDISFFPYVTIHHSIRIRNGKILVRISDTFETAPPDIQSALALILMAKLLKKKIPQAAQKTYRAFVTSPKIQQLSLKTKRKRGRKLTTSPIGKHFNLDVMFGKLNSLYFHNQIRKPTLSWSPRKTYRRLGHYDAAHETIVISKSLDEVDIPTFVVEYVVYHEMLHLKHPAQWRNGRCYRHTPQFKRDERKFPYFEAAKEWIEQNINILKTTSTNL
jgi:hypothetical protein